MKSKLLKTLVNMGIVMGATLVGTKLAGASADTQIVCVILAFGIVALAEVVEELVGDRLKKIEAHLAELVKQGKKPE